MKIKITKGQLKSQDVITIIGKRWSDKANGNTYHSVKVYVNGNLIGYKPFTYGYEDAYLQTAKTLLDDQYYLPLEDYQCLLQLRNHDIKLITTVSDVKKADL